ncbi:unnamed protein product [Diatraea saccharalis]|uniref:Uncharacterized protein n=1 Tax=Diatraea saccharalis TaxID=40085 RepID=A0A9N9R4R5_9NEOP|nr:unnamed protein product [Diatraea saccharalis]
MILCCTAVCTCTAHRQTRASAPPVPPHPPRPSTRHGLARCEAMPYRHLFRLYNAIESSFDSPRRPNFSYLLVLNEKNHYCAAIPNTTLTRTLAFLYGYNFE